jgi:uncharacterized ferritin-like protein (DUF455 family)
MFLHHYFVVVDEPFGSITPIIFESINSTTAGLLTPHDPLYEQLTSTTHVMATRVALDYQVPLHVRGFDSRPFRGTKIRRNGQYGAKE